MEFQWNDLRVTRDHKAMAVCGCLRVHAFSLPVYADPFLASVTTAVVSVLMNKTSLLENSLDCDVI
jgi:hypothetical protein